MATLAVATFAEPETYAQQLDAKVATVRRLFGDAPLPEIEVFESPPEHYRMRAEFRVWKDGDDMYYIMYEKAEGEKKPRRVRVDAFPRGTVLMNELMGRLLDAARCVPALREKLYQANFHTTLSGQAMVTLIYHKKLDDDWRAAAEKLRTALSEAPSSSEAAVTVIGRSHKQKVELDRDYVVESMEIAGRTYTQKQVEGCFSQPNGVMCQKMVGWAVGVTRGSHAWDLLELYCGNGNFTVPLAANFRRVVATEVSKASVVAAQHNMKVNGVTNFFVGRMSSEEFTAAWLEKRAMRRMEGLSWDELDMRTILVDPPRAGLDAETLQLLRRFDRIVYVSCNPVTLAANLAAVADSHRVLRFALFDQFPGTEHIECGAYLERRPEPVVH